MAVVRKFAFDVGWGLISSLLALAIGFLTRIFLAHWLGPDDLGLYSMIIIIQSYSIFIGSLGIPIALTKYAAEYANNPEKLLETSSGAFTMVIISGTMIGTILCAISWTLGNIFRMPDLSHLIRILSIAIPFSCGILAIFNLSNGLRRMKIFALLGTLQVILLALSQVLLVTIGLGVDGAVWAILPSAACTFIVGIYLFRKHLRFSLYSLRFSLQRLLPFSSKVFFAESLNQMSLYTGTMIIGYFLSSTYVGYYSVAITLVSIFPIIPMAIQRITYPATSEYWSKGNKPALRAMIDKSTKYSACILLPIGLFVGFFAPQIIGMIFGIEYIPATPALRVLVIAGVLKGGTIIAIGSSFTGIGRPDLPLKFSAIVTTADIALNIILVQSLGILGGAITSSISASVMVILFLIFMPRVLGTQIDLLWYAKAATLTIIAVALFWMGTNYFNPYLAGSIVLCVYLILIVRFLVTGEDRNIFRSVIRSLKPRLT